MGIIKDYQEREIKAFQERKKVEFIKPSALPEMGAVTIDAITVEDWNETPIVYFSKAGDGNNFKTFANYQLTKIYEFLCKAHDFCKYFEIGDTGHFEIRTSKKGKKYIYFVVYD